MPHSLHLRYLNDCVIISRALISSSQGGYMAHAARASFTLRACLWQGRRAHLRAATPPSPNQSLAKHNRKASQLTENKHHQPKSIASFCRVSCHCAARRTAFSRHLAVSSTPAPLSSLITRHSSLPFLIATRRKLEIGLTRSQQTRKHFLIATFSGTFAAQARPLHAGLCNTCGGPRITSL
jgi:hypothetical protein